MMIDYKVGFKYYRDNLPKQLIYIYDEIYNGILRVDDVIKFRYIGVLNFDKVWQAILLDNPLIFYVTEISIEKHLFCEYLLKPKYRFSKSSIDAYNKQIESFLVKVAPKIMADSDYHKEKQIHDILCRNLSYEEYGEDAHNILGPIINKRCVCEGFSKLAKILFDYVGISSLIISGYSANQNSVKEAHSWNIVKIDGDFYHLDTTFDKTISKTNIRYDYFNLTDDEIMRDHIFATDNNIVCGSDKYNYFNVSNVFARTRNDLKFALNQCVTNGKNSYYFKIPNPQKTNSFDVINNIVNDVLTSRHRNYTYEIIPNECQNVYEINWQFV